MPYPAGGPTDAIARFVAQDLSVAFGHNVVVDNRAGASGAVGTRAVAHAAPNGYTIVFGNNQTHGNNMFLLKEPGYDAVKDFAPLAGVGAFEHAFVVRKESKAHGLQRRIEGTEVAGRRVLVVEDTSTTGGSVLTAVDAVRAAGGEVVGVAVIVDRSTGAKELIEAAGVPYCYAVGLEDLDLA